jgi:hypothetical protein
MITKNNIDSTDNINKFIQNINIDKVLGNACTYETIETFKKNVLKLLSNSYPYSDKIKLEFINRDYKQLLMKMKMDIINCNTVIVETSGPEKIVNVPGAERIVNVPGAERIVTIPAPVLDKVLKQEENKESELKLCIDICRQTSEQLKKNMGIFIDNTLEFWKVSVTDAESTPDFCNLAKIDDPDIQIPFYKNIKRNMHKIATPSYAYVFRMLRLSYKDYINNPNNPNNPNNLNNPNKPKFNAEGDAAFKKAFIIRLMQEKKNFIKMFSMLMFQIMTDIKYNIIDNTYSFISEVAHFRFEFLKIPKSEKHNLINLFIVACKSKLPVYQYMFKSEYGSRFKKMICEYTVEFIDFFQKIIRSNVINLSTPEPLHSINYSILKKIKDSEKFMSITEISQIINFIRLYFNTNLTEVITEDTGAMLILLTTITDAIETNLNSRFEIVLKGGNLFKINLIKFIKDKRNIDTDLYKKYKEEEVKLSDWDFSTRFKNTTDKDFYKNFYKEYQSSLHDILRNYRNEHKTMLREQYNKCKGKMESYLKTQNIKNINLFTKLPADSKSFYTVAPPSLYSDFSQSDRLNNENDNDKNIVLLDEYVYHTFISTTANIAKITDMEVLTYTDAENYSGFDLMRLNLKFKTVLTFDDEICIKFNTHAELFDFGVEKQGSDGDKFNKENYDVSIDYKDIEIAGKNHLAYSLIWFISDIIKIYLEKVTPKDKKRVERVFESLMIMYHTDKPLLKHFFTMEKRGKTLYKWVSEMVVNEKIGLDALCKEKYKKQLQFLLNAFNADELK